MSGVDSDCDACSGRWPDAENHVLELTASTVYLHDDQFFPGWTVLVLKQHATELFQLSDSGRNQLMQEVNMIAAVLADVFAAIKINYALLGNLLPHIHWHLIPRLASDPSPREAVFSVKHETLHLSPRERTERINLIRLAVQHYLT